MCFVRVAFDNFYINEYMMMMMMTSTITFAIHWPRPRRKAERTGSADAASVRTGPYVRRPLATAACGLKPVAAIYTNKLQESSSPRLLHWLCVQRKAYSIDLMSVRSSLCLSVPPATHRGTAPMRPAYVAVSLCDPPMRSSFLPRDAMHPRY